MVPPKSIKSHTQPEPTRLVIWWPWLALMLILILTSIVRVRLLSAPLERDEGEYAYAGQLILQGIAPYDQVYNMKMPGIYAAYALILALFGQTHQAVHLGLLIINALTGVLLFLITRRLFNPLTAVGAAATWAMLSLSPTVQGVFAHAEHFVVVFALGGLWLLLNALEKQKLWMLLVGSILLGLGFLMKQHGGAFILFAFFYLIYHLCRRQSFSGKRLMVWLIIFCGGILLPFTLTCGFLTWAGTFEKFWFWTFSYARQYISAVPMTDGFTKYFTPNMKRMADAAILLYLMAAIGPIRLFWNRTTLQHWVFPAGLLLFGFLAVCPGFYFRPHYFVLLLPAIALWAGIGIDGVGQIFAVYRSAWLSKGLLVMLVLIVFAQALYKQREFLFTMTPTAAAGSIYYPNPFSESLEIAEYIKQNTTPDDRIAILGSEPQIYFYSQRQSASGYIYAYDLVKNHDYAATMRQEMIQDIESNRPKFIIFVVVSLSWLATPSEDLISWFQTYKQQNYQRVGTVDIYPDPKPSQFRWIPGEQNNMPQSQYWLEIYRRID